MAALTGRPFSKPVSHAITDEDCCWLTQWPIRGATGPPTEARSSGARWRFRRLRPARPLPARRQAASLRAVPSANSVTVVATRCSPPAGRLRPPVGAARGSPGRSDPAALPRSIGRALRAQHPGRRLCARPSPSVRASSGTARLRSPNFDKRGTVRAQRGPSPQCPLRRRGGTSPERRPLFEAIPQQLFDRSAAAGTGADRRNSLGIAGPHPVSRNIYGTATCA